MSDSFFRKFSRAFLHEPDGEKLFSRKDLTALIIPLMIDLALTLMVGMFDSIMVASVGEEAVSGVSLVDSVMQLIIMVFSAFATGGAVVAGQYMGARDNRHACASVTELVWFSGAVAMVIMAGMYAARFFILKGVFGSIDDTVYYHAYRYLMVVCLSIPALSIYQSCAAVLRTMGLSAHTMRLSFVMNVVNICGNAVFIFGFGMGTFGAALSTVMARWLAAGLAVWIVLDEKKVLHLKRSLIYRPNADLIKKILFIGVPNGVENGLFQLGKILLLSLISGFGTGAIAANSIATVLASIQCIPGNSMQLAAVTVISRCVGAGDEKQTRYYNRLILFVSYVIMAPVCILVLALLPAILFMYRLSPQTYEMTWQIAALHSVGGALFWPLSFVLPGCLRAAGDVKYAMTVSAVSMWVCRISLSYFLAARFGMGVFGVWVAMQVDWICRIVFFVWRWKSGGWRGKALV